MDSPTRTYNWLDDRPLQPWYSITITTEGDTKFVYFHSRIHVRNTVRMNPCFSVQFTDHEILRDRDLITNITNHYGLPLTT